MDNQEKSTSTLVAIFDDREAAERALDELLQHFHPDKVGFVLRGSDAVRGGMITDAAGAKDRKGALAGITAGTIVGSLLGAAVAIGIPGVGPVIAGGIFTSILGGAIAGAATGGLLGAMTGLGISEQEAKEYERAFQSGKAIVAVKAGARAAFAGDVLRRHGGYDIQTRGTSPVETAGPFSEP